MRAWSRGAGSVVIVVSALVLTACSSDSGGGSSAGGAKVAAVIKGLDNPFFQSMEQGIKAAAAGAKVSTTIQAANSITDTSGQADKLTSLAGQDYSCFLVNPISGTNLVQGLARVAAKGKPIVNIDSPVDAAAAKSAGAKISTYVGTDNVSAGKLAGGYMVKLLPGGGKVAMIGGISGDVTSGARLTGFKEGTAGKLTVVQTVSADWDRQQALTAVTTIMRAQPDLVGFFAANDDMGLGIVRAVDNAQKTDKIKVISVDGNKDALESVKAGSLAATVAQYPYAIGQMGLEACVAASKGKKLPANVEAPVQLVTPDNAERALASTPKPFDPYDDPFKELAK